LGASFVEFCSMILTEVEMEEKQLVLGSEEEADDFCIQ
jgi:hypothetical protein